MSKFNGRYPEYIQNVLAGICNKCKKSKPMAVMYMPTVDWKTGKKYPPKADNPKYCQCPILIREWD